MSLSAEDILIRMWRTPNPYALKFTLNVPLKTTGKASFYSPEDCPDLPLVRDLFSIPGLKKVYLFQNQMTLTHDGQIGEKEIEDYVDSIVRSRVTVHNPDFEEPKPKNDILKKTASSDDPKVQKIEAILDRTIRPGLQADGGDLEVISVQNEDVKIHYQGACGGCPSAFSGTLDAIENILRHELNNPNLTVTPL